MKRSGKLRHFRKTASFYESYVISENHAISGKLVFQFIPNGASIECGEYKSQSRISGFAIVPDVMRTFGIELMNARKQQSMNIDLRDAHRRTGPVSFLCVLHACVVKRFQGRALCHAVTQAKHLWDALAGNRLLREFLAVFCELCGDQILGRALCHSVTQAKDLWDAPVEVNTFPKFLGVLCGKYSLGRAFI